MAITPGAGYMVDPNNPNAVIPTGSAASVNNPNAGLIATGTSSVPKTATPPSSPATTAPAPAPTAPPVSTTPPASNIGSTGSASGNNTFTGLVGQVANTAAAGSPTAAAAGQGALAVGNNQAAYESAKADYQKSLDDYNTLQSQIAEKYATNSEQPIPLEFQQGQQQVLAKQYAAQLDAAQQKVTQMSNVLNAGIAQEGAQTSAYSTAGNIGNTAQSTAQSGLSSAIGASAPTGAFPFVFNPQTGQFTNASTGASMPTGFTGDYSGDTSKIAQAIIQRKTGYSDGEAALSSYYGNTAEGSLTQAIIAAGGNPTVLKAQAAAQSSNVTTAGTTPTNTAASGYSSSQQQYMQASTANTTAQMQSQNLLSTLEKTGINSSNVQKWNTAINGLSKEMGSANQSSFITALKEAQTAYITLLGSVGAATPTVNGQQATDVLTAASTPKQIAAAIDALNQAAYAKLEPLYQQYQTYQSALGGSGTSQANSSSSANYSW